MLSCHGDERISSARLPSRLENDSKNCPKTFMKFGIVEKGDK